MGPSAAASFVADPDKTGEPLPPQKETWEMSNPALPRPFGFLPVIPLEPWRCLLACLLAILIIVLLPSDTGLRSSSPILMEGWGLTSLESSNRVKCAVPTDRAEGPTLSRPVSKGKEVAASQKLLAAFHQLPLSFIPNRGQVDERVKFYGRSGSASFFFARDEVVYAFVQRGKEASLRKVSRSVPTEDSGRQGERKIRGHAVRIQFIGANPDPMIEGGEKLPGKVNYFIGNDPAQWQRGLPTYGQVRYRELWPGIDLIYRGTGQIKYEFIVKPGADPTQIRLVYRGIEGLSVSDAGDLILRTASGELRDSRPVAYQEIGGRRVRVEAGFRVEGKVSRGTAHPPRGGITLPTSVHGVNEGSRRGPDLPLKEVSGRDFSHAPFDPGSHIGLPFEGDSQLGPAFAHGFEVKGYDPAYPLILDPGLEYSNLLGGKL